MIEGGVVAAYLAALLGGAAKRFVDGRIDGGLKSLYDRVTNRLGGGVVRDLRDNPNDASTQNRVARAVENVAAVDRRFAEDIAAIVDQLDRAGGRSFVNSIQAHTVIQNQGGDQATHGGVIHKTSMRSSRHPSDYSGAPVWVKVVTALGAVLALGGMVLLVVDVATVMSSGQDEFGRPLPPGLADLKRGGLLFMCGLAVLLLGAVGRSMSRRGW